MSEYGNTKQSELVAAVLSPLFLGMAPVLGKLAMRSGSEPFTVAAVRTALAALLLWGLYLIFWRRYIYIYLAGFLGCAVVGMINGIGSLMYYNGLSRVDASMAQLLNGTYLLFVVLMVRMGGQVLSWQTGIRVLLAMFGLLLITGGMQGQVNWLGVGLMLGNALLFAGTVILSQRVLYEMPAQTVTLYVLTVMAVVVVVARVVAYDVSGLSQIHNAIWPIAALALTTALSRLTLFAGVKTFGSLQTTLLAITEIAVAMTLAHIFLDERLTVVQWVGVGAFLVSLILQSRDRYSASVPRGAIPMPNMAGIIFQQMAFAHAFGNSDLSQDELDEIRRMMGLEGPLPSEPPLDYSEPTPEPVAPVETKD